jgi:hypothetical protein
VIKPTAAHHGSHTLAITASDVYGGSTTVSLVLQVNRPPTQSLATPSVTASRVRLPFSYALPVGLFTDADGDALSYSIVTTSVEYPKPVWLSLSGVTLSGTPTSNTHAPVSLLMSVSDGRGGSATFVLRVDVPNTPPRLVSGVANQTFDTSGTRSLAVPSGSCDDADGDAMSYALTSVSGGSSSWFVFTSGVFSFFPQSGSQGVYNVSVSCWDGYASAEEMPAFWFVVNVTNRSPTLGVPA